ncbi:MAG: 3-phosphoshikimate 1-carboxyvinyltransferase [Deltaproteobacteria bacterium]|nr:3-phosphoshikimate 1-carboxyvinyltransferase [Deltaproteobacteria bacterium]
MQSQTIHPAPHLRGTISVPGDKSISHRALIFSAIAEGDSRIRNLLLGEDVLATMRIMQQLGVKMSHKPEEIRPGETLIVHGVGLYGLRPSPRLLDCGNSGTTMRLMMGLLSAQPFESTLTGDHSLNRRPMERVIKPLAEMGARFDVEQKGGERTIRVKGTKKIGARDATTGGIKFHLPVASAQVKSALMLAALYAAEETLVIEPSPSRDHTERLLAAMGVKLFKKGNEVMIHPAEKLQPLDITVPGDFSSAAFFVVGGLIVPHSDLILKDVGINPTRSALADVLREMGGSVRIGKPRLIADEPVADIHVQSSPLRGFELKGEIIPKLIDEIPIFAVAAVCARGKSSVSDAAELRVKESDRIAVLAAELKKMGVVVEEKPDGLVLSGTLHEGKTRLMGGAFDSHGDHRIAMSCAIGALAAQNSSVISDVECVATSFPGFFEILHQLAS